MGFVIINNQKVNEHRIEWRFEGTAQVYVSTADKFKRNVQFWKAKHMIGDDVQVEILNGAKELYDYLQMEKGIEDVEHEIIENDEPIIDQSSNEPSGDELDAESSLSENTEDTDSAPKRKSRKKTTDL